MSSIRRASFHVIAWALVLACAPAAAVASGFSKAKVVLGSDGEPNTVKFTAARGEHVQLTVSIGECGPNLQARAAEPCLVLRDLGSKVGYELRHDVFGTQESGCLPPHSTAPTHVVDCRGLMSNNFFVPVSRLTVDLNLARARSASVRFENLAVRLVKVLGSPGAEHRLRGHGQQRGAVRRRRRRRAQGHSEGEPRQRRRRQRHDRSDPRDKDPCARRPW